MDEIQDQMWAASQLKLDSAGRAHLANVAVTLVQLDAQDHPNIAFTLGDNIGVYQCKGSDCINEGAPWDLKEIELTTSLPVDDIIFWPNCTIAGWAFQDPSLVLDDGGAMYVGYQAEDLSGGASTTDPTKPACLAGADMVLTCLALMR
jgi:hypothetical protein